MSWSPRAETGCGAWNGLFPTEQSLDHWSGGTWPGRILKLGQGWDHGPPIPKPIPGACCGRAAAVFPWSSIQAMGPGSCLSTSLYPAVLGSPHSPINASRREPRAGLQPDTPLSFPPTSVENPVTLLKSPLSMGAGMVGTIPLLCLHCHHCPALEGQRGD